MGVLHERLTGHDILRACRMMASHIRLDGEREFADAFQQRLDLMLRGLGAAPGGSGP